MEVIDSDKRQATRKALLVAARELVFEKGHDRVSIQEITARADVATGTYYNYFESKQDIFLATVDTLREDIAADLAPTRADIKDPAMLVTLTLRYYFDQAANNQDWHEFISCIGLGDLSLQQSAEQCLEDIQRGVNAGRFRVDDVHFTQSLISGMVEHVNQAIKKQDIGMNGIDYAIRSILQMLGLPDLVSKALTQTPLPPMRAPKRLKRTIDSTVTPLRDYTEIRTADTSA